MKMLVYGAGVIGSYLIHMLCRSGNDVSVVARKRWGDVLASEGLRITHTLQRRQTIDHPRIIRTYDGGYYDIVFSVMQEQQQEALAPALKEMDTGLLIFVGNNLSPRTVLREVSDGSPHKEVLFGFQTTGGIRKENGVTSVHWGKAGMTIGGLHSLPSAAARRLLKHAFLPSGYAIDYMDDMEGWLQCHMAFILPIAYLSYRYQCDLRSARSKDLNQLLDAAAEGYGLLARIGTKIRPEGDESWYQKGVKRSLLKGAFGSSRKPPWARWQ